MTTAIGVLISVALWCLVVGEQVSSRSPNADKPEAVHIPDEHRLVKHLVDEYQIINPTGDVRPVYNRSETINLSFGVALINIVSVDEENQEVEFLVWERYSWYDMFLRWDPEDFGGIDHTRIGMRKPVWKPDMVLYNGLEPNFDYDADVLEVVSSNGNMLYIPPAKRKVQCAVEKPENPSLSADKYTCKLKYGSWTYDGFKLDVNFYDGLEEVDITDFENINGKYKLLDHGAVKNVKYYPCCHEPYVDLTFTITFQVDK